MNHQLRTVLATISDVITRRFRSGLEEAVAHQIASRNFPVIYEETTVDYVWPARPSKYTPDFQIGSIHIEAKGLFSVQDRHKMILVKQQHPSMDIRFVFSNADAPIYKGSPTRYRDWAEKHGFAWCNRTIPDDWFTECKGASDGKITEPEDPRSPSEKGVD